jgi:hypothetical protein
MRGKHDGGAMSRGSAYRVMACLSRSAAPEEVPGWLCEAMVVVLVWRVEGAVPTLSVERVGTRLLDLLRR